MIEMIEIIKPLFVLFFTFGFVLLYILHVGEELNTPGVTLARVKVFTVAFVACCLILSW